MLSIIAKRLAKTRYVRKALEDQTETTGVPLTLEPRMVIGLILMAFSYIIAWPAVAALGFLSAYLGKPSILIIGGIVTYGCSHLMFIAGAWVAGASHVKLLMRRAVKILFEKTLRRHLL